MSASMPRRATPELVDPGGFADLLPAAASAFVSTPRLELDHPGTPDAEVILQTRRRHLRTGAGPLIIVLPAGAGPGPRLSATRTSVATDGEVAERIVVELHRAAIPPDADAIDHWSLDLDHDGALHRAMLTGDGEPPERIVGETAAHDADRWIALRIVDRAGSVVTAETTIRRARW